MHAYKFINGTILEVLNNNSIYRLIESFFEYARRKELK